MNEITGKLTVYFENPFWVGILERIENGKLFVSKVTFGAEPKDYEVCDFVCRHYYKLKFSSPLMVAVRQTADNPKRRQRNAGKELQGSGIGTKSQQALAAQREELKTEHRQMSREQREAEKLRQFELKQQKRKEKHRGH